MLVADDGGRAVFAHHIPDHVGLCRLPVFGEGEVARDEVSAIGAGGRREAGRQRLAVLTGSGGKAEVQRGDEADRGAAEFLLLDVLGGIGASLEEGFKDGASRFSGCIRRDAQNVRVQFCGEGRVRRLWLDLVGLGRNGQGRRGDGKRDNQGAAKHEPPAKPDE